MFKRYVWRLLSILILCPKTFQDRVRPSSHRSRLQGLFLAEASDRRNFLTHELLIFYTIWRYLRHYYVYIPALPCFKWWNAAYRVRTVLSCYFMANVHCIVRLNSTDSHCSCPWQYYWQYIPVVNFSHLRFSGVDFHLLQGSCWCFQRLCLLFVADLDFLMLHVRRC